MPLAILAAVLLAPIWIPIMPVYLPVLLITGLLDSAWEAFRGAVSSSNIISGIVEVFMNFIVAPLVGLFS